MKNTLLLTLIAHCSAPVLATNNKFDKRPLRNGSSCHKYKCVSQMMHSSPRCGLYRFGFSINPATSTTRRNVGGSLAATAAAAAGAAGVDLILAAACSGCLVIEPLVVLLETGHDA